MGGACSLPNIVDPNIFSYLPPPAIPNLTHTFRILDSRAERTLELYLKYVYPGLRNLACVIPSQSLLEIILPTLLKAFWHIDND